jgi:ABC-type lipoprotein release transport system permease subunit
MKRFFWAVLTTPLVMAQTAQEPVVLTIDVENYVQYRGDVADPAKFADDPNPTTAPAIAFMQNVQMGDIVAPANPLIYVASAAAVLVLTVLAAWMPAVRAAHVDPIWALRDQ